MDLHEYSRTFDETSLLQHYDLLEETGILEEMEDLKADVRFQREIIEQAFEIFKQQNVETLIEYLISHILDKFVPSHLVFMVKPQPHAAEVDCYFYRNLSKSNEPIAIHTIDPLSEFFEKYRQPVSFSLFEHEVQNRSAITEILGELRRLEAEMLIPVLSPGGLTGLIVVGKKLIEGEYTNREIAYINRLMQFSSVALQNVVHYRSASRDPKTSLYNHSYFMNRLEQEISRYRRYGRPFSVLICDLDHFKQVNDTYGHPTGDLILIDFARILEQNTRSVDIVARYGGEEFILLLNETTRDSVWSTAERIRTGVANHEFVYGDVHITITCSIGICQVTSTTSTAAADLVNLADNALYWAKENGRNRTSLSGAGLYFKSRYYYANEQASQT